jgi:hypothetical protein
VDLRSPCDLPHGDLHVIIGNRQIIAAGGEDAHAELNEGLSSELAKCDGVS